MDAFYASIEQHDNPEIAGRPVVVGWPGGRGVVAAASYEVRRFGVRSAMPMRTALRLCPDAVCVRPRMERYQEVSADIFRVFRDFTPLVEGLSLDEAYLDVTDSRSLFGDAPCIARAIKRRIRDLTGLTASVGVAGNKLVAKIASDLEKPDGLTVIAESRISAVLDPLSVRRLPGLGRKRGAEVEAAGIHTFGELRQAPDALLWPLFGRFSQSLRDRAAGLDDRPVQPDAPEKSLSAEDTFEHDVWDPALLQSHLARLAELAGERLRSRSLMTGCVGIKVRQQDFTTHTRQVTLSPPTQDSRLLNTVAAKLLSRWLASHSGAKLRLLGVVLTELSPATQLKLFDATPGGARLDAALDAARSRFGNRAVQRGYTK